MSDLPYRIAVLCYLFDDEGRVLLLHRCKPPNFELYSPIGGKLEQGLGESPTQCAIREIHEEAGIEVSSEDLHLTGIVSEHSYEDSGHWLLFCYEVMCPISLPSMECDEGRLVWYDLSSIMELEIPDTDRRIIWPLFLEHRRGFFMVHIDCTNGQLTWQVDQSVTKPG